MVISENSKPSINMVGGTPNGLVVNRVSGARRAPVTTMRVRSPAGVVEEHTAPNARDLIRFHGWKQASAPKIVDDHPDTARQQSIIEAMQDEAEAHFENEVVEPVIVPDVVAAPETENPDTEVVNNLAALRAKYKEVTGKEPDARLGIKKLKEAINS